MYSHCKKRLSIFPSPARMALTKLYLAGDNLMSMSLAKLSLAGNNLIIPGQEEFG
jgi:hypothetical protein